MQKPADGPNRLAAWAATLWIAAVMAAHFTLSAGYYAEKLRVFTRFLGG